MEAHRLQNLVARALSLVEKSPQREHLYEVAGDVILELPKRVEDLGRHLDRTSYAISTLGKEHLRERLPLADRKLVDEAVDKASPLFGPALKRMSSRVAERHLRADLNPPLGYPGGPCHVIQRIRDEVRNPALAEDLVDEVERGRDLNNPASSKAYPLAVEVGTGRFKHMVLTSHVQYRMDLRGIHVPLVRRALATFLKAWGDEKSRKSPLYTAWEHDMAYGEPINWTDTKLGITVVFRTEAAAGGSMNAHIVTTYWKGDSNPRAPGEGGCDGE